MSKRNVLGPADLKEGDVRGYPVGKRNVLIACVGGRMKALDDWCNHAGCLLSGGRIQANLVICPCHEVGFDLDTGKNVTSPQVCDDQRAFQISVVDGNLILEGFEL